MFGTFCDIATDEAANEEAASFIRRKIAQIVKDPETRRKLMPSGLHARRPLCDSGYYETFNRPNVSMVNLKETPITHLTEKGIVTDGRHAARTRRSDPGHRIRRGRRQLQARRHPRPQRTGAARSLGGRTHQLSRSGHHGLPEHVHDPGPQRTVHQPAADHRDPGRVDRRRHPARVGQQTRAGWKSSPTSRRAWTETCGEIADQTLFPRAASWIFGANIPGKKRTVMFYLGGMKEFRAISSAEMQPDTRVSYPAPTCSRRREHRWVSTPRSIPRPAKSFDASTRCPTPTPTVRSPGRTRRTWTGAPSNSRSAPPSSDGSPICSGRTPPTSPS